MTRINCVPVDELSGKHLVAEYRELPRLFKLVEAAQARGEVPDLEAVPTYRLGPGHVRFFYPRMLYVKVRFCALVEEMRYRGYLPKYERIPPSNFGEEWDGLWFPSDEDRARLRARSS